MTDEEKKEPITMDEPAENDPTADELVVIDLQRQVKELTDRNQLLEYQNDAMGDMARMNAASHAFAALIGARGEIPMDSSNIKDKAIRAADDLIQHYQDILEAKSAEFTKRMTEQAAKENSQDDTVN